MYTTVMGRPPAEADIQKYFKLTPPSVHNMIMTLERRGLIRRTPRQARAIEVSVPREELPTLEAMRVTGSLGDSDSGAPRKRREPELG